MARTSIVNVGGDAGQSVQIAGWVNSRRDHGKIIFIDLRDRTGVVQIVFTPQDAKLYETANTLRSEWVVEIEGKVKERPKGMINPNLATGAVEIEATSLEVLARARELPFPIDDNGYDVREELRLKHRYLDLRRPRMLSNLQLRARLVHLMREFLEREGFTEVETPILTKSTPEGSRDFLVPSRLQPGKFYALPQSPQQYKQLLMVAGLEKYFQFARALRDEDMRADRALEHTQLDLEMSFVEQRDVMNMIERLVIDVVKKFERATITQEPFPVITYADAMKKYGADKFDARRDPKNPKEFAFSWVVDFPVFEWVAQEKKWTYSHNPFTGMKPEHVPDLLTKKNLDKLISWQYDLVCNGYEIGGGGIRITDPKILKTVFEIIGHSPAYIDSQFGHILEAFEYGVPPHGGIALGIDRLAMLLAGETSMREVVAFPTTASGVTAVMDAPSEVASEQLEELGLRVLPKKKSR